jgi:hypothetical protein
MEKATVYTTKSAHWVYEQDAKASALLKDCQIGHLCFAAFPTSFGR